MAAPESGGEVIKPKEMNNSQLCGVCCEGGFEGTDYEEELERRLDNGERDAKLLEIAIEWLADMSQEWGYGEEEETPEYWRDLLYKELIKRHD